MTKYFAALAAAMTIVGIAIISNAVVKLPSFVAGLQVIRPAQVSDYSEVTVKIVTSQKTSGGTGVILDGKVILTNKHICEAIQNGGYVIQGNGQYQIKSYKPYPKHDLCMIATDHDFGVGIKLATKPGEVFSPASISGHPGLLPLVVTTGHFSGRQIINLIVGIKDCPKDPTPEEFAACLFLGGVPIEAQFEGQLVTATIKPGSSGSPVFNEYGELTNLAFASSSPMLDYAFTVPQEYLSDFYYNNMLYRWVTPKANAKHKNLFLAVIKSVNEKCIGSTAKFCHRYSFLAPEIGD